MTDTTDLRILRDWLTTQSVENNHRVLETRTWCETFRGSTAPSAEQWKPDRIATQLHVVLDKADRYEALLKLAKGFLEDLRKDG